MTGVGSFLAGFGCAAALAAGAWFLVAQPSFAERERSARQQADRLRRDVSDAQMWAESEHRRKLEFEKEVETLKRELVAKPPPPSRHKAHTPTEVPEKWDSQTLRMEIMRLAGNPRRIVGSPRYELVVRGLKAYGEPGVELLLEVLPYEELGSEQRAVAASLLGSLEEPRGVEPLLAVWATAEDPILRRAVLRGLANIPGDAQTPVLVGVWSDPSSDPLMRLLAMHGLARRRHPTALEFAAAGEPGAAPRPVLRKQALETLHAGAWRGEWKETALLPVFGKALRTAEGDPQREIALLALEGFWSKDSVADLEAFAAMPSVGKDLAERARRAADAIKAGKPRPEGAGVPSQPKPAEPPDPDSAIAPAQTKPSDPGAPAANPDPAKQK